MCNLLSHTVHNFLYVILHLLWILLRSVQCRILGCIRSVNLVIARLGLLACLIRCVAFKRFVSDSNSAAQVDSIRQPSTLNYCTPNSKRYLLAGIAIQEALHPCQCLGSCSLRTRHDSSTGKSIRLSHHLSHRRRELILIWCLILGNARGSRLYHSCGLNEPCISALW